jgi:type II secretory pathway pseudopilin PulG
MTRSSRHSALTLVEILVVLGIMAILFAIGVPAVKKIIESFDSSANVRSAISAALGNARSIAMSDGTWAGLRFQQDKLGNQYMILIRYDYDATGLASGFRAVESRKPMKLPESIGVMDLRIRTNLSDASNSVDMSIPVYLPDGITINDAASDLNIDSGTNGTDPRKVLDTTTFSMIFSKEGRLVTHDVRVRNRQGNTASDGPSTDDIFNIQTAVDAGAAEKPPKRMFYQDDYAALGLGQEPSRNAFVIYDKKKFKAVPAAKRWSLYLHSLPLDYVNPSTGELVGMR